MSAAGHRLFRSRPAVVGMIHLGALPGAPAAERPLREIERRAVAEARIYREAGIDGVLVENMHDLPYLRAGVGPEIVASMAVVGAAVRAEAGLPCGVQVLAAANREALAVALAAGLDFIRAEGFAFAHVADEGLIQSSAAELLRYRKAIGAERVQVWADIKKKHSSHAITADVGIAETAKAVEFMRADAVIVTGGTTGEPPRRAEVEAVRAATRLPVWLGSGISAANLGEFRDAADGFIVGSDFKAGGRWSAAIDRRRLNRFIRVLRG